MLFAGTLALTITVRIWPPLAPLLLVAGAASMLIRHRPDLLGWAAVGVVGGLWDAAVMVAPWWAWVGVGMLILLGWRLKG